MIEETFERFDGALVVTGEELVKNFTIIGDST